MQDIVYHNPQKVVNPKRFIRSVHVLYDGKQEGFSLALIDWEGVEHIGIRWNIAIKEHDEPEKQTGKKICHGSPATNGIPSWFILPQEIFNPALFDVNSEVFMNLIALWKNNKQ